MTDIGAHLLGRRIVPDDRDWSVEQLRQAESFNPETTLNELSMNQHLGTYRWSNHLLLWSWLKGHSPGPQPGTVWADPVVLDQGNYGTCVGNGWAGWGDSAPIMDSFNETDARAIYYEATAIDGHPDDPDSPGGGQQGASVRAGAKAMQRRGKLAAYGFGTLEDAVVWLDRGPVVIGSDWTEAMFKPNASGFVRPRGEVVGGHCYLLLGYQESAQVFTFRNSWGAGWGTGGNFKMHRPGFERLLSDGGECCMALELAA
jgi:hypothetical protein